MVRLTRTLLIAGTLALLVVPTTLTAQRVTGQVLDRVTGEPLPYALVTLLANDSRMLERVMANETGQFNIAAPGAGNYFIRAERLGYETALSDVLDLSADGQRAVRVSLAPQPVSLAEIKVTRDRTCSINSRANDILRVWLQARRGLEASAAAERQQALRFTGLNYERRLTTDSIVLRQTQQPYATRARQPYRSLEAADLADHGYIRTTDGMHDYFAPDAETLLSREFEESHCFSLRRSGDGTRTGIEFTPAPQASNVPGIAGTMWLDTHTAVPRAVEFFYVNARDIPFADHAKGGVEFRMLPNGLWLVHRWYIRMPAAATQLAMDHRFGGTKVTEFREIGGQVNTAEAGGVRWAITAPGSVSGVVFDSTRMQPLRNAVVSLSGTGLSARTDEGGKFSLSGVPAGTYSIAVSHPRVDSLPAYPNERRSVVVASDGTARLELGIAPIARSVIGDCADRPLVHGFVRNERGERLGNVRVSMSWDSVAIGQERAGMARVERVVQTDARGRFWQCDVPADHAIALAITLSDAFTATQQIRSGTGVSFHEVILRARRAP